MKPRAKIYFYNLDWKRETCICMQSYYVWNFLHRDIRLRIVEKGSHNYFQFTFTSGQLCLFRYHITRENRLKLKAEIGNCLLGAFAINKTKRFI